MHYQLTNNVFKNVMPLGNEYPEMLRKIYVFYNCVCVAKDVKMNFQNGDYLTP